MEKSRTRSGGFTLIELMVTLVLAIIVLSLGIPGIARLKQNNELRTLTNDLVVALSMARSEAIKRGENVSIGPVDGSWNNGWRITISGPDPLVRVFQAPPTGASVTAAVSPLTFGSLGNVAAAGCFDVAINGIGDVRSVPVSTTGRVASCKASCAAIGGDATLCD